MTETPTSESSAPAMSLASRELPDFSLMLGGPLYQFWRKTRLSGDALELLHRRATVLVLLTWLPLLLLSMVEGHAWSRSTGELTFLRDLEMHARLLIALPLLLAAELVVHRWTYAGIRQFVDNQLIPDSAKQRFDDAIASTLRLRNSVGVEVTMLVLVYVVGIAFLSQVHFKVELDSWYGAKDANGGFSISLAGGWAALVSLPIFQFLSLRWFYRIFIWARLLFKLSRIDLNLMPTHPDRCGGIGFLSTISQGFAPIMLAQSTLVSGMIADRIFFEGAHLTDFTMEIFGLLGLLWIAMFGPMFFFMPLMARAKLLGLQQYGTLADRYVRSFNVKWLEGRLPPDEPLLGNPDFSGLADLGAGFEVVRSMRWVPITWRSLGQLIGITLLPIAPLMLTMFPLNELLKRLLGVLF